jgi:hypothetical protein
MEVDLNEFRGSLSGIILPIPMRYGCENKASYRALRNRSELFRHESER